ncbi:hypothetical protein KFL_007250020 [Klebsormidium nitens]|uniref:EGF-like domain-containing protein n=1 Tax=Klebsormidium nitens TaxID=105231 RepID=A0A1Y1IPH1_KLENI|nr:hypothetical protein KFL_007250020 [Klebsormidium nitens]|eukprot:GAQ91081.1 hypothetical protein KFL_007250020 [Klebsormidium nitens]
MAGPAAPPSHPTPLLGGLLLLLLPLLLLAPPAAANVRLAFPPARGLGDFLYASQLQPGPCGGGARTIGAVTQLQAAALVNVSWHNSHPTPGARFSLALLDAAGSLLVPYSAASLLPGGAAGGADPLQTWQLIQLPALPCPNCTLRLTEILPTGAPGMLSAPPELWSCADVNVTLGLDACSNQCQGWGTCVLEPAGLGAFACQCNSALPLLAPPGAAAPTCAAISGTYGEVRDACVDDSDCGAAGLCVARTPSQPRRCFCKAGWRGPLCTQRSQLSLDVQLDLRAWEVQYPVKLRAPGVAVYARIVGPPQAQLIEVAMAAVTESYVSVGWRPASLDQAAALPALLPGPATLVRESPLAPVYQNTSLLYDALAPPAPPGPNLTLLFGSPPSGLPLANGTANITANATATIAANATANTTANTTANATVEAAANVSAGASANATAVPGGRRRLLQAGAAVLAAFNRSSPVVAAPGRLPPSWLADITACYAVGEYFKVEDLGGGAGYGTPLPDGALGGTDDIVDAIGRAAGSLVFCKFRRPLVSANLVGDQPVTLREDQTVMWAVGQSGAQAANESRGTLDRAALEQLYAPTDMLDHGRANRGVFGNLNLILGRPVGVVSRGTCPPSPLPLFDCTFRINARLRLHWRIVAASISLALEFPASAGWAALGWSSDGRMVGATAVLAEQPAAVRLVQLQAQTVAGVQPSTVFPLAHPQLARQDAATAVLSFTRPLSAGAAGASIVAGQASRLVWALAEDGRLGLRYHRLQNRGSFSLDFSTGVGRADRNPVDWYGLHGWLMAVAMGALLPLGLIFVRASRANKAEADAWYFEGAHVAFQLLGAAAVAAGLTIAFLTFLGGPGRAIHTLHGIVGLAVGGALLAQVRGKRGRRGVKEERGEAKGEAPGRGHAGVAAGWLPFLEYTPAVERALRLLHAGVGCAVLAGGNWAVLLGLYRYAAFTGTRIFPLVVGQGATLAVMALLWLLAAVGARCVRGRAGAAPGRPPSPTLRPWVPSELQGPFKQEGGVPALEYAHPLALTRGSGSQRFLLSDDDLFDGKDSPAPRTYSPPARVDRPGEGHPSDSVSRRVSRGGPEGGLERQRSFRGWVSP